VLKALSELEDKGYLNAVSRGGGKGVQRGLATIYELSAPAGRARNQGRKPAAS
jgi:hypothetical protein